MLSSKDFVRKPIELFSTASDASCYKILPESIFRPQGLEDVISIMQYCRENSSHLTFRAAGTSLCGQSQTNGILVDLSRGWRNFSVINNGKKIFTECGVIAGKINERLAKYGRKLGPDPASINSCTIGGVIVNNSSGMHSGVMKNSYHTLLALTYVLPSGLVINSADPKADEYLKMLEPAIYSGLEQIRDDIFKNKELYDKIIHKYKIKNTMGYSLNSFVDHYKPIDILTHLMVGSEGTLGFVCDATFATLSEYKHKLTGLAFFSDVLSASDSIKALKSLNPESLELMDNSSLKSVSHLAIMKDIFCKLKDDTSAILFEYSSANSEELFDIHKQLLALSKKFNLSSELFIASGEQERDAIWDVRKGLLPSLAGNRKPVTNVIIEDIAVSEENISKAVIGLQKLFDRHNILDNAIYGHALDGNLHFIMNLNFDGCSNIMRYSRFSDDLAKLIVDELDGSLKAEHGTGRAMAPYVEKEWGMDAYDMMKRLKKLIDPHNILNPGVILNEDKGIHLKNLKTLPKIDEEIDKCMECGFCEPHCPSKDLTLTPRKRIAIERDKVRFKNHISEIEKINEDFEYYTLDTCATDGLCGSYCPVGIDTGAYIKRRRNGSLSDRDKKIANFISNDIALTAAMIITGLNVAKGLEHIIGNRNLKVFTSFIANKLNWRLPVWNGFLPSPASVPHSSSINVEFIYFPCCMSRIFGKPNNISNYPQKSIMETMLSISRKAGVKIAIPDKIKNHCCGMAFLSKGYKDEFQKVFGKTIEMLFESTNSGTLPVVVDSSSCCFTFKKPGEIFDKSIENKWKQIKFLDTMEFAKYYIIDKIPPKKKTQTVVLHNTCSATKMGLNSILQTVAEKYSDEVIIPESNSCCGFAGDRGLLYPELSHSATKDEAKEVSKTKNAKHYSSNIPCEIGMSKATGRQYLSIVYLIDQAT